MDENRYLWPMLRGLPYFRALLRAVEAAFYGGYDLQGPVLDLGSGDGHFASLVFEQPIEVGIDPWLPSLREAHGYPVYKALAQAQGARMPFPKGYFSNAISNSVLEHIPDLQPVLNETARVLKPGALFLFCVPNHRWPDHLSISSALRRLGLRGLAASYIRLFTHISRHENMLSPEEWEQRLGTAGFELVEYWHYFPPEALHALEWGHYFGFPSQVARWLTGRWVLAPWRWNLGLTERLLRKHARAERDPRGTYSWYVARRR
jgi:SAM-dependent methyltransferase